MEEHPKLAFILLHAGHDFLPPDDAKGNYYNGTLEDASIQLALEYDNVYLEISAVHAEDQPFEINDNFRYPRGDELIQKIIDAGAVDKMIWAGDGNHIQGALVNVMKESSEIMVAADMTNEQRCTVLAARPRASFAIGEVADSHGHGEEHSSRDSGAAAAVSMGSMVFLVLCMALPL